MEKTIQMMKESGLFDSLVDNILKKDMPKEAVEFALDKICEMDENFEDTFFNDLHELGVSIIWKELCSEVEKRKGEDLKKQESAEQEIHHVINPDNFEQVLINRAIDVVIRKVENIVDEIFADVMKKNK